MNKTSPVQASPTISRVAPVLAAATPTAELPPRLEAAQHKRWKYLMGRRVLRLYEVAQISLGIPPSSKLPTAQFNEELAERITDLCAWMAPAFSVDGNVLVVEHPNNDLEDSMHDQYVDAWVGLQLIKEKYGRLSASTEAFEASITSSPLGSDSGVASPIGGLEKGGYDPSPNMQQKMLATAAKLLVVLVDQQIGQVRSKSIQRLADALVERVDSSRYAGVCIDSKIVQAILVQGMK